MNERERKLEAAARLALLFHGAGAWGQDERDAWIADMSIVYDDVCVSRTYDVATTRALCDAIREALK